MNHMLDIEGLKKYFSDRGILVRKIDGNRISVVTDADRISFMETLAEELGGTYSSKARGSSVGGVIYGKYTIYAKPTNGGSGAGSETTSIAESAQCVYCASSWYEVDLHETHPYIDITETVHDIIEKLPRDWIHSVKETSKALKLEFGDKDYLFHRGSEWVENLETVFSKLNKVEGEFSNINKWTPADIYLLSNTGIAENFANCITISDLNSTMRNHMDNRDVIGVSLKKTNSPTVAMINTGDKVRHKLKDPFYTMGKNGFFKSKDAYIYYDEGQIQYRSFTTVNFQGEIKGKTANHGKIGGGVIRNIVYKNTGHLLEFPNEVFSRSVSDMETLLQDFYQYYIKTVNNPLSKDEFVNLVSAKEIPWTISKYCATQMMFYILESGKAEDIVNAQLNYAMSMSDMSTPFVKVS